jgi:hypothetical protein
MNSRAHELLGTFLNKKGLNFLNQSEYLDTAKFGRIQHLVVADCDRR